MNSSHYREIMTDERWLKAIVTGSLWASFEIVVGSFLHNLRVPFAGTILTSLSVVFLIAILQVWPHRGMIIRAGIICSIMKSVSPSAVILGPMIGILSEAIIVEGMVLLGGRNLFSYLLAGALAGMSAIVHKIIMLLILYGGKLVEVYINLVDYLSRQIKIQGLSPENLVFSVLGIYALTGILAALGGYLIGKRSLRIDKTVPKDINTPEITEEATSNKHSVPLLVFHLLFIPLILFMLSRQDLLIYSSVLSVVFLLMMFIRYRSISRKLHKPTFWLQIGIIIMLTTLFIEQSDKGKFLTKEGLVAGYLMFLRALMLVSVFSGIGHELANPRISDFLRKRGFTKLYVSVRLAFITLPSILESTPSVTSLLRSPLASFTKLVSEADSWLRALKSHPK